LTLKMKDMERSNFMKNVGEKKIFLLLYKVQMDLDLELSLVLPLIVRKVKIGKVEDLIFYFLWIK
jgi:hypothetical protein